MIDIKKETPEQKKKRMEKFIEKFNNPDWWFDDGYDENAKNVEMPDWLKKNAEKAGVKIA